MNHSFLQKTFLSPFLFGLFLAVAVTGVLMFFHVKNGPIVVVHEWVSIVFVVVAVLHLVINLTQLAAYFKLGRAWAALTVAAAIAAIFVVAGFNHRGGSRGPENRPNTSQPSR